MLCIPGSFMLYEYMYLGLHDSADFLSFERQFFFDIFEKLSKLLGKKKNRIYKNKAKK